MTNYTFQKLNRTEKLSVFNKIVPRTVEHFSRSIGLTLNSNTVCRIGL